MRKLLGVLAVSSICLVLGFGTTGCTPTKAKDKKEFALDSGDTKHDRKDGTFKIKVKHGKVESATVAPAESGVAVKKDDDTHVLVTVTLASLKDEEKEYTVTVKGKDDAGKEKTFDHKFKIAAKPKADPTPEDVKLAKDEMEIAKKADGDATDSVAITKGKAEVEGVKNDKKKDAEGVTAKVNEGKVWVTVAKTAEVGEYWVLLKSTEKKEGAKLKVTVAAAGATKPDPEKAKFDADNKEVELKLAKDGTKYKGEQTFKLAKGKEITKVESDNKAAKATFKGKTVTVTIEDIANEEATIVVTVTGKDENGDEKTAKVTVKVKKKGE